jgi:hypothetical protein
MENKFGLRENLDPNHSSKRWSDLPSRPTEFMSNNYVSSRQKLETAVMLTDEVNKLAKHKRNNSYTKAQAPTIQAEVRKPSELYKNLQAARNNNITKPISRPNPQQYQNPYLNNTNNSVLSNEGVHEEIIDLTVTMRAVNNEMRAVNNEKRGTKIATQKSPKYERPELGSSEKIIPEKLLEEKSVSSTRHINMDRRDRIIDEIEHRLQTQMSSLQRARPATNHNLKSVSPQLIPEAPINLVPTYSAPSSHHNSNPNSNPGSNYNSNSNTNPPSGNTNTTPVNINMANATNKQLINQENGQKKSNGKGSNNSSHIITKGPNKSSHTHKTESTSVDSSSPPLDCDEVLNNPSSQNNGLWVPQFDPESRVPDVIDIALNNSNNIKNPEEELAEWKIEESDTLDSETINYLISREPDYAPDAHYMDEKQPQINWIMRAILLDWMMEVSKEYTLKRETYHYSVNYIDRFLSVFPNIKKCELQLVGVTAMYVASKVEVI